MKKIDFFFGWNSRMIIKKSKEKRIYYHIYYYTPVNEVIVVYGIKCSYSSISIIFLKEGNKLLILINNNYKKI